MILQAVARAVNSMLFLGTGGLGPSSKSSDLIPSSIVVVIPKTHTCYE